jgi:hypothetical protein
VNDLRRAYAVAQRIAKLYSGTPSHHIAFSHNGQIAHNGARKPADVQCRAEANQTKKHRAKEICSVEQRLAGRGSRGLQTFLQTEKLRTAQILGDLIEHIPSES